MEESTSAFQRTHPPQPTYTDPKGTTRAIDPQDETVRRLRQQLDDERWANRQTRYRSFYSPYWSRPVVYYHDPYNSFFWWWLLDRSVDDRAYWAYSHRNDMDPQRYSDLLARDAQLDKRIHQLEVEQRPVDPSFVPQGIDPDLVYTHEYVNAVYNPVPVPSHHRTWIVVLMLAGGISFGVWFVFFKRW